MMRLMSSTHKMMGDEYRDNQREFFDRMITIDWNSYQDSNWDRSRKREVKEIMNLVGPVDNLLDVGCGCGFHDVLFAEHGVKQVVGIDYSPKSIEQANLHYPHEHVNRRVFDVFSGNALPEGEFFFDACVSFQVIEHVRDGLNFLRFCSNHVRKDGMVCIATPNYHRAQNRLRSLVRKKPVFCDPMHFHEYHMKEMAEMGSHIGLVPVHHFFYGFELNLNRFRLVKNGGSLSRFLEKHLPNLCSVFVVMFKKVDP